jgi:hypothetical protein
VCDTIARFFQFPFRTPRWRASQVLVRSATDRSHSADHAPADPILMKSADVLSHCLTASGDRECCTASWADAAPATKADVCLLRGEGGAEIGRQATQQRRSASNRSERGEATGAVAEGLMGDSAASPLTAPCTSAAIGPEGLRPCGTRRHQAPERQHLRFGRTADDCQRENGSGKDFQIHKRFTGGRRSSAQIAREC